MRNYLLYSISMLFFYAIVFPHTYGQSKPAAKRLNAGDRIPRMELGNVLNYHRSKLSLGDFAGKYIILDFWNQGCVPCIAAFPEIDSLQKHFKDKLQIILVNKESKESTIAFFNKHKKIKMPCTPLVTGDTILRSLLRKEGYPYSVWMDTSGVIRYISGGYNTTMEHVANFVNGGSLEIKDVTIKKNWQPVLMQQTGSSAICYYSYISHCTDSVYIGNTESERVDGGERIRVTSSCSPVVELYKKAFREYDKYNFSYPYNLVVDVKDSTPYFYPHEHNKIDEWQDQYSYNYDLMIPKWKKDERYKMMQADLERYFNLAASVEKRKVRSLVLVRSSKADLLRSKGGKPQNNFNQLILVSTGAAEDTIVQIINQPYAGFISNLKIYVEGHYPFIEETGYEGNIDIVLRVKSLQPFNLEELRKDLKQYGMELKEDYRMIDVLVIKEKNLL